MRSKRLYQLTARRELGWKVGDSRSEKLDSEHIFSRRINGTTQWGDSVLLRRNSIN